MGRGGTRRPGVAGVDIEMVQTATRPHALLENWRELRSLLDAFGAPSLRDFRARNFARFENLGLPGKHEEYKYISFRPIEETRFVPAYGATVDRTELEKLPLGAIDAVTVAFINGQYAPELSSYAAERDGVWIGPLEEAWNDCADVIGRNLGMIASLEGKLGSSNDERFVWLNGAYLTEGALVYVPKGAVLETPVHLIYINRADHGAFASFPRNLIILEEGAQAKIMESFIGLEGAYLTNAVSEVRLGENAVLEHTLYQQETEDSFHLKTVAVDQEAGSVYTSINANFGGRLVRNDINVWLNGEHTHTWLSGANVGLGEQVIDNHTRIDHAKPNCESFEVYKSILGDTAVGVFNGKIFVYEDAQKTDAKQTNQGILLSPTAAFNTKPQLEIFADDVKCTHGATVGQLREDALFYLRARGIPQKEAQAMLVYAFAAEVLDKISVDAVRESLEKVLFDRLNQREELPG